MALVKCQKLYEKYEEFVKTNPNVASELESILRWVSYLTAGRFDNSSVISELIYASSSLLKLLNDLILRHAANIPVHINSSRSGIRLLLLIKHKQGILKSPPISPLNRRRDLVPISNENGVRNSPLKIQETLKLKRSGRTVRSIDAAPPLAARNWKLPNDKNNLKEKTKVYFPPTMLEGEKFIGEVLHVTRPLLHLATVAVFGNNSWKPWIAAIGCDMTSLQLLGDRGALNHTEQLELSRRALVLLMYLLRSPLYEKFTKQRILAALLILSKNIPVVGRFIKPIADYLPDWQRTYFHAWSM